MKSSIGYKIVPNSTATADVAPYLGSAIPADSLAFDNILAKMVDSGAHMTVSTARYFLEAFYELAAEEMKNCARVTTGSVSIFPAISGSFPSEDAELDPERNKLFVDAEVAQSLQAKVGALVPGYAGDAGDVARVKISSVICSATGEWDVIRGTGAFGIAGIDLTVPDGEDESLELWNAALTEKVCDIAVDQTDGGQRIGAHLVCEHGVPKGKYKVRLASHGIDPTSRLAIVTRNVALAEAVPGPIVTKIATGNDEEESPAGVIYGAQNLRIHGSGLALGEGESVTYTGTLNGEPVNGSFEADAAQENTDSLLAWDYTDASGDPLMFDDGSEVTFSVKGVEVTATFRETAP